jgi:hypothetical protein
MGTLISDALRGKVKQNAFHWLKKQLDKKGGSVTASGQTLNLSVSVSVSGIQIAD